MKLRDIPEGLKMIFSGDDSKFITLLKVYGLIVKIFFEFSMPIYSIFAFPWPLTVAIWVLFIIWQWPVSTILIKVAMKEQAKRLAELDEDLA